MHHKCLEVREKGDTEDGDAKIMQDQEAYFDEVASKVYPVLAMAESYKKSYAAYVKKQLLDETLRSQEEQKVRDKQNLSDVMNLL